MTLGEVIKKAYDLIGDNADKRHAAMWMFLEFLEIDNTSYYLHIDSNIEEEEVNKFFQLLNKYINNNIPVQYLIGHSYFYGRKFLVNKSTLIPRSETDLLVDKIIKLSKSHFPNKNLKILDLGTGTGCIGVTLKKELPNSDVTISDISIDALKVAKRNAKLHNVDVKIIQSDWFKNIKGRYDIIISNPPYVSDEYQVEAIVSKEPSKALYGGGDGLDPYRIIMSQANVHLESHSILAFEHGYDHKDGMRNLYNKYFEKERLIQEKDLASIDRYTFIIKGDKNG